MPLARDDNAGVLAGARSASPRCWPRWITTWSGQHRRVSRVSVSL